MKGTHDRHGNVTIEFNSQGECIAAPPVNGEPRKWLPCEYCGTLTAKRMNVVSGVCESCDERVCTECGTLHKSVECAGACCTFQGGDCGCFDEDDDRFADEQVATLRDYADAQDGCQCEHESHFTSAEGRV